MKVAIPKMNRHISVSLVVEKFNVNCSVARAVLKKLLAEGSIKVTETHSKQALYYPTVAIKETVATEEKTKKIKKEKKW